METNTYQTRATDYLESDEKAAEEIFNRFPHAITETFSSASTHKREHIVVPVAADSTQQAALLVLKKLQEC